MVSSLDLHPGPWNDLQVILIILLLPYSSGPLMSVGLVESLARRRRRRHGVLDPRLLSILTPPPRSQDPLRSPSAAHYHPRISRHPERSRTARDDRPGGCLKPGRGERCAAYSLVPSPRLPKGRMESHNRLRAIDLLSLSWEANPVECVASLVGMRVRRVWCEYEWGIGTR